MCNLNSPTRDQICAPGSGRPSLNRWATREVLHGLPSLVSPFMSWFLDTQKGHRHSQRGDWSDVCGNASGCSWALPTVLLLQGGSGSSHTAGLSELKSAESYPGVTHGLDFVPHFTCQWPWAWISPGRSGAWSGLLYLAANWEEWKWKSELPEEARKYASLMAKMKAISFFSLGHCFFSIRDFFSEERTWLLALFISNLEKY